MPPRLPVHRCKHQFSADNPQIEGAAINQGLAPREADPFLDEKLDGDVSEEELEDKVNQYRELYRKQREEQTAARQEKKHD